MQSVKTTKQSFLPARRLSPWTRLGHLLDRRERTLPGLLLVPVLLFFIVWNVVPTLWMVGLSFYRYSLISGRGERFIQFENYADIVSDSSVWLSFSKTLVWVFASVSIETILGFLLGLLFWHSSKLPGRRFALTLLFAPMMITPVAASIFFRLMYDPTFGVITFLIGKITGAMPPNLLGERSTAFYAVLAVDIWMWTPFMILITLAALGSVPQAELEAAQIDKLSWVKKFRYVILPNGKFILMLGILLRTIDSFKTMDLIFSLTRGGPGNTTELIAITLYRKAFEAFNLGWASALAVILLLTAIAFTSIYLFVLNRRRAEAV
ncbi:MAG: sugar ABC transporter permease [Chloroflexi bacterium]|nr:sugar ABC transporter permease [Chloroflexota bacterium]